MQEQLDVASKFDHAVQWMVTSDGPPRQRLLEAWKLVATARSMPAWPQVSENLQEQVATLEKKLTRFGGLEKTIAELTADEVKALQISILRLNDKYFDELMRKAR